MSFAEWMAAYPTMVEDGVAYCPDGDGGELIARVVGERNGGWGLIWCPVCRRGIGLCRLGPIPDAIPLYQTAEDAEFPDIAIVQED